MTWLTSDAEFLGLLALAIVALVIIVLGGLFLIEVVLGTVRARARRRRRARRTHPGGTPFRE